MRIEHDGRPLPFVDGEHWSLTLPPGSEDPSTMAARFKVVVATSCLDEPIDVESVASAPDAGVVAELHAKWPKVATVWIDRDGVGSAAVVTVGSTSIDTSPAKVVVGTCDGARAVRVGDAIVGEAADATIVDAQGGHCYEVMTNGFPAARLEGKRVYDRAIEAFIDAPAVEGKTSLRRCAESLAAIVGAGIAPRPVTTVLPWPPSKPSSKPAKPPRPRKK